jgi:hypothetical protein
MNARLSRRLIVPRNAGYWRSVASTLTQVQLPTRRFASCNPHTRRRGGQMGQSFLARTRQQSCRVSPKLKLSTK